MSFTKDGYTNVRLMGAYFGNGIMRELANVIQLFTDNPTEDCSKQFVRWWRLYIFENNSIIGICTNFRISRKLLQIDSIVSKFVKIRKIHFFYSRNSMGQLLKVRSQNVQNIFNL